MLVRNCSLLVSKGNNCPALKLVRASCNTSVPSVYAVSIASLNSCPALKKNAIASCMSVARMFSALSLICIPRLPACPRKPSTFSTTLIRPFWCKAINALAASALSNVFSIKTATASTSALGTALDLPSSYASVSCLSIQTSCCSNVMEAPSTKTISTSFCAVVSKLTVAEMSIPGSLKIKSPVVPGLKLMIPQSVDTSKDRPCMTLSKICNCSAAIFLSRTSSMPISENKLCMAILDTPVGSVKHLSRKSLKSDTSPLKRLL